MPPTSTGGLLDFKKEYFNSSNFQQTLDFQAIWSLDSAEAGGEECLGEKSSLSEIQENVYGGKKEGKGSGGEEEKCGRKEKEGGGEDD